MVFKQDNDEIVEELKSSFKQFCDVVEFEGKHYLRLTQLIPRGRLETMVDNFSYALDTIKALSYYFQTKAAREALDEIKSKDGEGEQAQAEKA